MPDSTAPLGKEDFSVLKHEKVFDGFFKLYRLQLQHKKFAGDWTGKISRLLYDRGEAAAAIVYDPHNDLVALVDQFRVGAIDSPFGPWCLEVVAGITDEGEDAETSIRRELVEEAGIKDVSLIPITKYYPSPGGSNEQIHLYCALVDLSNAGGVHGLEQENEDIYLRVYPAEQVFDVMLNARTNNSATLIGLLWLQANRQRLMDQSQN